MTEDEVKAIKTLKRALGLCESQRDSYLALLKQVLKAYDRGTDGEYLYRAMQVVRSILETTA
jgi:hypothetical protein